MKMINESSILKELFHNLERGKASVEEKDAVYEKIETLMGSCVKEKLDQALEGVNIIDALVRDISGESIIIAVHALSMLSLIFEFKPEIVNNPEAILRELVSNLHRNASPPKDPDINLKTLECLCIMCQSLTSLGKEGPAVNNILLQFMTETVNDSAGASVKLQAVCLFKSLLQFKLLEFSDTNNWLKVVISLIFDENPSIREAALQAAGIYKSQITGEEEYLDILSNNLVPSKYSKMLIEMILCDKNWALIWRFLVEILGKRLHNSSALVNSLLAVEEKAFKTSNVETKKEAFSCWNSLLLNFALEQSVLSSDRRVKLLTIPLRANNCRNGEVALVKLNLWWNVINLLKSDASNFSEMVITPFLGFCYGSVAESSHLNTNGQARLSSSNVGEACAKLYSVMRVPSLHALCELLSKSSGRPLPAEMAKNLAVKPLLESPIVGQKVFSALSRLLTQCLGEAVLLGGHDLQQTPYIIHSWHSLLMLISQGTEEPLYTGDSVSKDLKNVSMVKELLRVLANLVETSTSLGEGKGTAVILSMIESMVDGEYAFPPSVLNSHAYGVGNLIFMNSSPSLYLSVLFLAPTFAVDNKFYPRIKDVFSKTIRIGCSSVLSPLPFARAILKKMDKDTCDPTTMIPYFQELWVVIANHLSDVIDKEGSVSEGNGASHDFHCIYGMLMFPITCALKTEQPQELLEPVLKSWSRLFELFVINAQLVVTAQPHEAVEELSRKILSVYKKSTSSWLCLASGLEFLLVMYQKSYFDNFWKGSSKKLSKGEKPDGFPNSQELLVQVTSKICANFSKMPGKNGNIKEYTSKHISIVHYFVMIFSSTSTYNLVNFMEKGLICTSYYLELTSDLERSRRLRKEVNILWEKFLCFLEKVLPECTSKTQSVVETLSPLFLEAFRHPLAQVVESTKIYWNRSLGQYFLNGAIPKSFTDVLDDVLKDTSNSEDVLANMVAIDTQTNVFAIPEKTRAKSKSKAVLPLTAKDSQPPVLSLENSVEFKVILPKPKTSILTDHQKEMMKERSVDIPALYQDLTQDSMSQCCSQENSVAPVLEPAVSIVNEEDANCSFSENLQSEKNTYKLAKVKELVTFKLTSSEKSNSTSKENYAIVNPAFEPTPERVAVELEAKICDSDPKVATTSMNDLSRRRGRKRKQIIMTKNVDTSPILSESRKVVTFPAEVSGKGAPLISSNLGTVDGIADLDAKSSEKESSDSAMLIYGPNQQSSGENDNSVPVVPLPSFSLSADAVKATVIKVSAAKDSAQNDQNPNVSVSAVKIFSTVDSPKTDLEKPPANTGSSLGPGNGQHPVTVSAHDTAATEGKKSNCSSSIIGTPEVSKSSVKETNEINCDSGTKNEEVGKMGLANVKISSPRKISDVEFSNFRANQSGNSGTNSGGPEGSQCTALASPKSKASAVLTKLKMYPVSPKSKLDGNSPRLDKWVIVTKRENEEKSSAKPTEKHAGLDGGSKTIPLINLDSDTDVSEVDEYVEPYEIYVFSNSEDLVGNSQDPLDTSAVGPLRKCSINLPRVSDILSDEVAFIQYEGRTVKCNMSPGKEDGKTEEESKKVTPNCSPVVTNLFSPRASNSRGARILNMAQGNKEKCGADENPESPVRDAGNRVMPQNSDSNIQNSPLSHPKGCELNVSTPPTKKPRRVRPMHVGNVSPQNPSLEIGCVASEGAVTIHSYSPNASPGGSLMKRKKRAGRDSISPLNKKTRRVSFADPIVSREFKFRAAEEERNCRKSHRCLNLPDASDDESSSDNCQQGKVSPSSDNPSSNLKSMQNDFTSCLLSTQQENNDASEDIFGIPLSTECEGRTVEDQSLENQNSSDKRDCDSVREDADSTKNSGNNSEGHIVVLSDMEHNKDGSTLVVKPLDASSINIGETDTTIKESEHIESGMEIEIISKISQESPVTKTNNDGERPKETVLSHPGHVLDDERVSEETESSEKISNTTPDAVSEQDLSQEVFEKSKRKVSTPDVEAEGYLSDSGSCFDRSLNSSKTSDSDPSVIESDFEEPRKYKFNTQEEAFPPLRDCTDSISEIIEKLTTKIWKERCKHSLEKRNVFTIGDLSRLTEDVVERIPFKGNKWKNLTTELKAYHSFQLEINQSREIPESSSVGHTDAMEVEVNDSEMQNFRETLSRMSAKDILKELQTLNLTDAVLQEIGKENNCPVSSNALSERVQTRSEKLSKSPVALKTFESVSVQVSEFEVLSELELIAKKQWPAGNDASSSISVQVSADELMPAVTSDYEPHNSKPSDTPKSCISKSIPIQVKESELGALVGRPVQAPKISMSTAVQVSDGDMLSRIDSYEVLNSIFGRSDFKDAVGELSQEKLMKLMKLAVRNTHEKVVLFDGSVDLTAKRILQCVVREFMKQDGPMDTVTTLNWIFQNTIFSKEYVKAIPCLLSGVDESVVSELILNQESIMESIQNKMSATRGLKMAVDVLEKKNISLLPEEDIDRLNDILDNHRTCGELFDRYTRVLKDRIVGNNFSR